MLTQENKILLILWLQKSVWAHYLIRVLQWLAASADLWQSNSIIHLSLIYILINHLNAVLQSKEHGAHSSTFLFIVQCTKSTDLHTNWLHAVFYSHLQYNRIKTSVDDNHHQRVTDFHQFQVTNRDFVLKSTGGQDSWKHFLLSSLAKFRGCLWWCECVSQAVYSLHWETQLHCLIIKLW